MVRRSVSGLGHGPRLPRVDRDAERAALEKLDTTAGILAAFVSPNTIYQKIFEFLAEAGGPGTYVASPPVRRPDALVSLSAQTFTAMAEATKRIADAKGNLPARAVTSLRWYAEAQAERSRPDAFVKFWIALEALVFSGNGSPRPLIDLLSRSYERDAAWVCDTLAINSLALLRNDIVHGGQRPMLHGNLLAFVDALYVDALRARIGLPNEKRSERALPENRPFQVSRWRNSGDVATTHLPVGQDE